MHWSVVGHEKQKTYLEGLIARGALPHALLFTGPEGLGKRMLGEDLLAALVPPDARMLDTMRLSPVSDDEGGIVEVSVEQVRGMRRWASLTPTAGRKVVVMDAVERLNSECANTLLKLLEEPPAYAHFILITGNPASVLPTIASRCQRVDFSALTDADMARALGARKLDDDERKLLAVLAGGRPGAALTMLERGELADAATAIASLQEALKGGDAARIALAKRIADGQQASQIVSWWLAYTHSRLAGKPELGPLAHGLIDVHAAVSESSFNTRLALEHFLLATHSLQK